MNHNIWILIQDRTKKERDNGKLDKGAVYATGGGKYPFPIEEYNDTKIRIRNYLEEDDDTGELYVKDWRLVGFGEWEDSTKGGGSINAKVYKSIQFYFTFG